MAKGKLCRWKCGRRTDRRCGICIQCITARDERNRRIDAGIEAYVPPAKRPGHRLYEGKVSKPRSAKQIAALARLNAIRTGDSSQENANGEGASAK